MQKSQSLLDDPSFGQFSVIELEQAGIVLAELVHCISARVTEEEFLERVLNILKTRLSATGVYIAISDALDPAQYRLRGSYSFEESIHRQLKSNLEGLLVSGIDSISSEILDSLNFLESADLTLVRSPLTEPERLLLLAFGAVDSPALAVLTLAEPIIRSQVQVFRSKTAQQQGNSFLQRLHETSTKMVRHLLIQSRLYSTLLEDAQSILQSRACAVLLPTDETRTGYYVKAQVGFGENARPIPDALFSKAFVDYELNERTAIVYKAGRNSVFLLIPLTQRNSVSGILLFSGTESSFQRAGTQWREVAQIFGDWVSMANETVTLFDRFAASQTEWENTFDSIADPIYIIDDVYRLKKMNKSLASYSMKSIKVPLDPQCYRYLFNQNSICPWCPVPKSLVSSMPETVEAPLFSSGTWELQTFPFTDKNENRRGSINILRDITLLKRMQEQLIETEKLASAGKLISGVAHEVRNPLFGISATVRALANELKNKQDIQSFVDIIMSETTRLNRLMEDLLNYTRPVKIDKNPSDLMELVNEVLEQFKNQPEEQKAQFQVISGDKIPAMNMDRNKMKQVLFNLFENGIQHGGEEARIEVFVQYLSLADPPEIHLVIKDNGSGISRENLRKVFDPFFTTRKKGTGLGLSIVRKVIHDHGGRISVESHPGIGTTFRVTLPIAPG
jgi:nitrogen-specific signal transduction histidine kinase